MIINANSQSAVSSVNGQTGNVLIPYGDCETLYDVAAKTVTVSPSFSLTDGVIIAVRFMRYNTANNPTLNVNNTGAIPITTIYGNPPGTNPISSWQNGQVVLFRYFVAGENDVRWSIVTPIKVPDASSSDSGLMSSTDKAKTDFQTNPNLLDNWYFVGGGSQQGGGRLPINQRGNTSYTATGYCIDRWWRIFGTAEIQSNGLSYAVGASENYGGVLRQPVQSPASFAGKTVTISALITSVSGNVTIGLAKQQDINAGMVNIGNTAVTTGLTYLTMTVPNDVGSSSYPMLVFSVGIPKGASVIVQAVKLELGSVQTLAHQENGSWVLNEIPGYATELMKCCSSQADSPADTYADLPYNAVKLNPNLFDNWYMTGQGGQYREAEFPVNQRRQTSYSTAGYSIDRWYLARGSVSLTDNGLRLYAPSGNTGFISQYFDIGAIGRFIGKQMTVSALLYGAAGDALVSYTLTPDQTNQTKAFTVGGATFTIGVNFDSAWGTNSARPIQFFTNSTSGVHYIKAVKFEFGPVQTLAHRDSTGNWVLNEVPDYATELQKCQRFYYRIDGNSGMTYSFYAAGVATDATHASFVLPFPITMCGTKRNIEGNPTSLFVAPGYISVATLTVSAANPNSAKINVTVSGGLTAGNGYFLTNGTNGDAKFAISADY